MAKWVSFKAVAERVLSEHDLGGVDEARIRELVDTAAEGHLAPYHLDIAVDIVQRRRDFQVRRALIGRMLDHDGHTWVISGLGAHQEGRVYCHLASTAHFRWQKNGPVPRQICDWVEWATVKAARPAGEVK